MQFQNPGQVLSSRASVLHTAPIPLLVPFYSRGATRRGYSIMLVTLPFLLALAYLQEVVVYSQRFADHHTAEFGRLSLGGASGTPQFLLTSAPENGLFCLGTSDLPGRECFAYHEVDGPLTGKFLVHVSSGEIKDVSFARGDGFSVEAVEPRTAPQPNLHPAAKPVVQAPATKKVVRKRVVENDDGDKVEIEEEVEENVEVDTRLWIQKNWMYVVPPLVIFMIMSPEK